MGIPLQKDVKECPICRKRVDDFNAHMLICSTKKSLMQCHDATKHCVKELCNATELHVDVEVDISIASPFSQVGDSNLRPLAAAALSREMDKINKYAADCKQTQPCLSIPCDGYLWWDSTQHSAVCSESPHHSQGQELCTTKLGCTPTAKAY